MDAYSCLRQVAIYLGVGPMTLYAAFELDRHGGAGQEDWSSLSVTREEGQVLYAIVRALRPQNVIEFGACNGCSATHILQALHDNGQGNLLSVDIAPMQSPGPPKSLCDKWQFIQVNGITHDFGDYTCDLCFEDTSHTHHSTSNLVRIALNMGIKYIIIHDVVNKTSGSEVRRALDEVLGKGNYLVIEPGEDSLGLAVWCDKGH